MRCNKIISTLAGLHNGIIKDEASKMSYTGEQYGVTEWNGSNANPLAELNGFWLESSLRISPFEQVQILAKIF